MLFRVTYPSWSTTRGRASFAARFASVIFLATLFLASLCVNPAAAASKILFVGKQDDSLSQEYFAAARIAVEELNQPQAALGFALPAGALPVILEPFWITDRPSSDISLLQSICANESTRPNFVVSIATTAVATVVSNYNILTAYISVGSVSSLIDGADLKIVPRFSPTAFGEATLDAMLSLNFTHHFLLNDFSQFEILGNIVAISTPWRTQTVSFIMQLPALETHYQYRFAVRRSELSVASPLLALLDAQFMNSILRYPAVTPVEYLWVDGTALRPNFHQIDTSYWNFTQQLARGVSAPRGLFSVQVYENASLAASFEAKMKSALTQKVLVNYEHITARDMVYLWATAMSHLNNASADGRTIYNLVTNDNWTQPVFAEQYKHVFVGGLYVLRRSNGLRVRYHLIKNLHVDLPEPQWFDVAAIRGAFNTSTRGTVVPFPGAQLRYSTGSRPLPRDKTRSIIVPFFDDAPSNSPLWAPVKRAWVRIAEQAAASTTPLGVSTNPNVQLKIVSYRTEGTIAGTIESARYANLLAGGWCRVGPSTTPKIRAAYSTDPLIHVSFASANNALSNQDSFTAMNNFATPNRYQAPAIADLMQQNRWVKVCTLRTRDEDSADAELSFSAAATRLQLETLQRASFFSDDDSSMTNALKDIKSQKCRIMIVFVEWTTLPRLFASAVNEGSLLGRDGIQWVFSESASLLFWLRAIDDASVRSINWSLLDGSLLVRALEAPRNFTKYIQYLETAKNATGHEEPVPFGGFLHDGIQYLRLFLPLPNTDSVDVTIGMRVITNAFSNTTLYPSIIGVGGSLGFTAAALERPRHWIGVFNYIDANRKLRFVGSWDSVREGNTSVALSNLVTETQFVFYDGSTTAPLDRTSFLLRTQGVESGEAGALAILIVAVCVALIAGPLTWLTLLLLRQRPFLVSSNVFSLIVSASGLTLSALGALFWVLEPTSSLICSWRLYFSFLGACIGMAPLVAKAWHLRIAASMAGNLDNGQFSPISHARILKVTAAMVIPLLGILIAWTFVGGGFVPSLQDTPAPGARDVIIRWRTCSSPSNTIFFSLSVGYLLIIQVATLVAAWLARAFPVLLGEARWLMFTFANGLLISIAGIAVGFAFSFSPSVFFFSIPVCILFGALSTWILVHGQKIFQTLHKAKKRSMELTQLLSATKDPFWALNAGGSRDTASTSSSSLKI